VSASGIITTISGNVDSGFSSDGAPATSALLIGPYDITVDACGNLFFADTDNNRIREVSASDAHMRRHRSRATEQRQQWPGSNCRYLGATMTA